MNVIRMAVLVLVFQNAAPQAPPKPPVGNSSIEGVVLKLGSTDPIPGVDLELTIQVQPGELAIPPYTAVSGADGRFAFRNVGAATYKLVAARIGGGYTPVEYGQHGALGRGIAFPIANGEQKKDVRLAMAPVASITGRIVDSDNRPVGHAAVMAFTAIYRNGDRIVTMLELVHSDDRGEYRLFSLTPGRYYIGARLEDLTRRTVPLGFYPPGRMLAMDRVESPVVTKRALPTGEFIEETYQVVYYGGGTNPDSASPIDVGPGATVTGMDISLAQARIISRHIRGQVAASTNAALPAGTRVVAVPQSYASDMLLPTGVADTKGLFDLAGAVPGKYYLAALVPADSNIRTTPPPLPQFGVISIEVGERDFEGASITAVPLFLVTGKVAMENRQESDPDLTKLTVDFTPEPYTQGFPNFNYAAKVSANGGFSTNQLRQGDFWPAVTNLPAYAYMKSIRMGARDLLLNPLHVDGQLEGRIDIVVGTDASTLNGRVTDERQEPALNVKVVLVPDPPLRRRWDLYKTTATDQFGNFNIRSIAPGDYKIFAWEDVPDNIWTYADFLKGDETRGKVIRIGSSSGEKTELTVIAERKR